MLLEYQEVIEKIEKLIQSYELHRDHGYEDELTDADAQMYQYLDNAYQLLINVPAIRDNRDLKFLVDENHPLWDDFCDEHPYHRNKYAYSTFLEFTTPELIQQMLVFKGITKAEAGRVLGIGKNPFSRWVTGRVKITVDNFGIIADNLGLQIGYFFINK